MLQAEAAANAAKQTHASAAAADPTKKCAARAGSKHAEKSHGKVRQRARGCGWIGLGGFGGVLPVDYCL